LAGAAGGFRGAATWHTLQRAQRPTRCQGSGPASGHHPKGKPPHAAPQLRDAMLESGTDLRYIQDALGHSSIKACPEQSRWATEVYTHASTLQRAGVARNRKPASPLDDL
jgi:site-specific recombinase XerC